MNLTCHAAATLAVSLCFGVVYAKPSFGQMAFEDPNSDKYRAYSEWLTKLERQSECIRRESIAVTQKLKPYVASVTATCKFERFGRERFITREFIIKPNAIVWFGFPVRVLNYRSVYEREADIIYSSKVVASVEAAAASIIPRVRRAWTKSGQGEVSEPRAGVIEWEKEAVLESLVCHGKNTCEYSIGHSY